MPTAAPMMRVDSVVRAALPARFIIAGGVGGLAASDMPCPVGALSLPVRCDGADPVVAQLAPFDEPVWDIDCHHGLVTRRVTVVPTIDAGRDPTGALIAALAAGGLAHGGCIVRGARLALWSRLPRQCGLIGGALFAAATFVAAQRSAATGHASIAESDFLARLPAGVDAMEAAAGTQAGAVMVVREPGPVGRVAVDPVPMPGLLTTALATRLVFVSLTGPMLRLGPVIAEAGGRGAARARAALARSNHLVREACAAIARADADALGAVMDQGWELQRAGAPVAAASLVDALRERFRPLTVGAKPVSAAGGAVALLARDAGAAQEIRGLVADDPALRVLNAQVAWG